MDFKRYSNFEDLKTQDWDHVVQNGITDVPFLYHGYLRNWWETRGGGEWPKEADLAIITAKDESGLVGIAPLFTAVHKGNTAILLLGSIEISDYLDFIVLPEKTDEFFQGFLEFLQQEFMNICQMVLVNIPENSLSLTALKKAAEKSGWGMVVENAYHTPAIKLADDWESYLAGISKKQRHEIRRKLRGAQENADSVKWYTVTEEAALASEFEAFMDMMAQNPNKKAFLEGPMREQMRATARWAFKQGVLALSFLTIDGAKASAYFCLDYKGRIYVYNSGYDMAFSSFSPGWVHLAFLIQDAINKKKMVFDFLRGDETYKYRFGAEDSYVTKAVLTRNSS